MRTYLAGCAILTLFIGGIAAASTRAGSTAPAAEPAAPAAEPAATCGADLLPPSTPTGVSTRASAAGPLQKLGCPANYHCCKSSPLIGCTLCKPIGVAC